MIDSISMAVLCLYKNVKQHKMIANISTARPERPVLMVRIAARFMLCTCTAHDHK